MAEPQSEGARIVDRHARHAPPAIREAFAADINAALARARAETKEACERVAESEPELPGEPSEAMKRALSGNDPVNVVRAAVRVTKRGIAARIRAIGEKEESRADQS